MNIEWIEDSSDKNTNNMKEYYPFVFQNNTWKVDNKWLSITHPTIQQLFLFYENLKLEDFKYPHEPPTKQEDIECKKIYWKHTEIFNYDIWYRENHPFAQKSILYRLNPSDHKLLIKIGTRRMLTGGNLNESDKEDLENLVNDLNKLINNKPSFLKLATVSPKYEVEIKPILDSLDFLDAVTWDQRCVSSLEQYPSMSIIIKEWMDMDPKWEFRVFVWDSKITGISQQFLYHTFEYEMDILEKFYNKLLSSDIVSSVPYKEATLDIYFDTEKEKIFLIECNPFGAWSPAGSSLFEWRNDYDVLHGCCTDVPPLRLRK